MDPCVSKILRAKKTIEAKRPLGPQRLLIPWMNFNPKRLISFRRPLGLQRSLGVQDHLVLETFGSIDVLGSKDRLVPYSSFGFSICTKTPLGEDTLGFKEILDSCETRRSLETLRSQKYPCNCGKRAI